jgi:hypothetical protein
VRQALIWLQPEVAEALSQAIRAIEEMEGRVLLSFPPYAIVASIPSDRIDQLCSATGIQSVDTDEIAEQRLEAASDVERMAMVAWNEHLARQRSPKVTPRDLSWDAPGRLPPDPPPHIREMLRRREKEMRDDAND